MRWRAAIGWERSRAPTLLRGCSGCNCKGSKPKRLRLKFLLNRLLRQICQRRWMGTSVFKAAPGVFLHNESKPFQFHVACLGKPVGSGLVGPGRES